MAVKMCPNCQGDLRSPGEHLYKCERCGQIWYIEERTTMATQKILDVGRGI